MITATLMFIVYIVIWCLLECLLDGCDYEVSSENIASIITLMLTGCFLAARTTPSIIFFAIYCVVMLMFSIVFLLMYSTTVFGVIKGSAYCFPK